MTDPKLAINCTKNEIICNIFFLFQTSYKGVFGIADHKTEVKSQIQYSG